MSTLTIALVALLAAAGVPQEREVPDLRPDAPVQAALRAVLDSADVEARRTALADLRASAGGSTVLVRQLFLFGMEATSTREAMLPGVVLAALAVPDGDVVRALVPLLECEDPAVLRALPGTLSAYEAHTPDGARLDVYRPWLRGELAPGLVRHLFATDPGAALRELARARVPAGPERRALLAAEREVAAALWRLRRGLLRPEEVGERAPEALAALAALAAHGRWWARLHAVQVVRAEPALAGAFPLAELADDPHPLVREAVARPR